MNNQKLKPKERKFTIEKLRTYEGYENLTDEQAEKVLQSYDLFSKILFNNFQKHVLKKKG